MHHMWQTNKHKSFLYVISMYDLPTVFCSSSSYFVGLCMNSQMFLLYLAKLLPWGRGKTHTGCPCWVGCIWLFVKGRKQTDASQRHKLYRWLSLNSISQIGNNITMRSTIKYTVIAFDVLNTSLYTSNILKYAENYNIVWSFQLIIIFFF